MQVQRYNIKHVLHSVGMVVYKRPEGGHKNRNVLQQDGQTAWIPPNSRQDAKLKIPYQTYAAHVVGIGNFGFELVLKQVIDF